MREQEKKPFKQYTMNYINVLETISSVAPVKNNGYLYNSMGITRYDGAPQNLIRRQYQLIEVTKKEWN